MKELKLQQLAQWCGGRINAEHAEITVSGTQHDSRDIRPGDLFIAIAGEHFDGHSFVAKAREAGAAAALVSHPVEDELPQILVEDTLLAYGAIARAYRLAANIPVVAITGSVGKTTTKEMISCVLSGRYQVSKTQGNHNNNLGLPITIMEMPGDTELAVLERAVLDIVERTVAAYGSFDLEQAIKIEPQEQVVDALVREVKSRHVRRLRDGLCSVEYGFVLEDLLNACERTADHCSNIAIEMLQVAEGKLEAHEYLNALKAGELHESAAFTERFDRYRARYQFPDELLKENS